MDAPTLSRVFEPFFTTKETGKGSGLGLSMVYGFLKQSMGDVAISSAPGAGASVRLWLPRLEQAIPDPRAVGAKAHPGAGERILLAEDAPLVNSYVCQQLQKLGYRS